MVNKKAYQKQYYIDKLKEKRKRYREENKIPKADHLTKYNYDLDKVNELLREHLSLRKIEKKLGYPETLLIQYLNTNPKIKCKKGTADQYYKVD